MGFFLNGKRSNHTWQTFIDIHSVTRDFVYIVLVHPNQKRFHVGGILARMQILIFIYFSIRMDDWNEKAIRWLTKSHPFHSWVEDVLLFFFGRIDGTFVWKSLAQGSHEISIFSNSGGSHIKNSGPWLDIRFKWQLGNIGRLQSHKQTYQELIEHGHAQEQTHWIARRWASFFATAIPKSKSTHCHPGHLKQAPMNLRCLLQACRGMQMSKWCIPW